MHKDRFDISVKKFDEFALEYAERFKKIDSYLLSINKFCDLITKEKPKILELACGPGNITKFIKQRFTNSDYIAVDLAPRMIEIAKQEVKDVDFIVMDVRNISLLKTTFDAIFCSFCLPFLSQIDTKNLIADCSDILNKGAVIYISAKEGNESKAGFESTSFSGDSKIYFNYHNQKDLEIALEDSDFEINDFKRQDYIEPDGSFTKDLIFIGVKK